MRKQKEMKPTVIDTQSIHWYEIVGQSSFNTPHLIGMNNLLP